MVVYQPTSESDFDVTYELPLSALMTPPDIRPAIIMPATAGSRHSSPSHCESDPARARAFIPYQSVECPAPTHPEQTFFMRHRDWIWSDSLHRKLISLNFLFDFSF